jgi:threonine dehydratase
LSSSITVSDARATAGMIGPHILTTPVVKWAGQKLRSKIPSSMSVVSKLEMFQYSGTFKARGALSNILRLDDVARKRGVTAMSAGNHAVAVAYAASATEVDAKLVMQSSANPSRVEMARAFGAEILFAEDGPSGFAMAEEIAKAERRTFIHPFDGRNTALGTATLGLEFFDQAGPVDLMVIAVGGGGLAAGIATVTKQLNPDCYIVGVEPEGASSMVQSFASGRAENIGVPNTIADSLAPPMTLPYPFELCRSNIDELCVVTDDELRSAMRLIFDDMKLAVEPACAATTAALLNLAKNFAGKRVGLVFCGSNIDWSSFSTLVDAGK